MSCTPFCRFFSRLRITVDSLWLDMTRDLHFTNDPYVYNCTQINCYENIKLKQNKYFSYIIVHVHFGLLDGVIFHTWWRHQMEKKFRVIGPLCGELTCHPLEWRHNERDGVSNVSIVCLTICSGADQRKHQSSAEVTRKMFRSDDVIMQWIPLTKASDTVFWYFPWSVSEPTIEYTTETPVI